MSRIPETIREALARLQSGRPAVHVVLISVIGLAAWCVNALPFVIAGTPASYHQSSDATVHVVEWMQDSMRYDGAFENDLMLQNYRPQQSTGELWADVALTRIADVFGVDVLAWSIAISWGSLALFLIGVYVLSYLVLLRASAAFCIALASIIPVISLGLSSWGFLAFGFVPKELSLGIAVWLTILYVRSITHESRRTRAVFFAGLGMFANWYPVLFCHYALIVLAADVLRVRSIRSEHFVYGTVFLLAAPIALYDIFVVAGRFSQPDTSVIVEHYVGTLHSWSYLFLHYLRKQAIYVVSVAVLWFAHRRATVGQLPAGIRAWFCLWWSALIVSLVGVGIELFFPLYTKYLLSRASVWFYFDSMILVSFLTYSLIEKRRYPRGATYLAASGLLAFFLAQSSIANVYAGTKEILLGASEQHSFIATLSRVHTIVPERSIVLSNPDREANTLRAYGAVASYVSWKDGNVTLFNGEAAHVWRERYVSARSTFATHDYDAIRAFGIAAGTPYYLFNRDDITTGVSELERATVYSSGRYGVARLY